MNYLLKYIAVIAFMLSNVLLYAENRDNTNFYITSGLYLNGNIYNSDFSSLPGYPNCCTKFSSAFGVRPAFALGAEYRFDEKLFGLDYRYAFKVMYSNLSANYAVDEHIGNNITGNTYQKIISTYSLEPTLNTIATEHLFIVYPHQLPISYMAGFQVAFPLSPSINQYEKLKSPNDIYYSETGTRTRNEKSGELFEASSALFALSLGARYELYKFDNFLIVPEIQFNLGLSNIVESRDWKASAIRAGVALHYNIPKTAEKPIEPPAKPPMPNPIIPDEVIEPAFVQNIIVDRVNLSDGSTIPIPIRRFENTSHFSFYPKLFFNRNSTELNIEYNATSNIGDDIDFIALISDLFNNPNFPSIVRIGVTSDEESGIYERRVERIKEIISNNENKKSDHLTFEKVETDIARMNPALIEEARYAWFVISDNQHFTLRSHKILDSRLESFMRTVIHFRTDLDETTELEQFNLTVEFEGNIIHSSDNIESIFQFTDDLLKDDFTTSREMKITSTLITKDGLKKEIVNVLNIEPYLGRVDKIINGDLENELMVVGLFDFDGDTFLSFDKNVVEKALGDAARGKRITIIPTTDNIGNPKYNRELAMRRANAAIDLIRFNEGTYTIEYPEFYYFDNSTPMGRLLNRSVLIKVEAE